MPEQFPASEFDEWAGSYDASVTIDQFPFYGYQEVLERAAALAGVREGMRVLDLGTGTGNLAASFAALDCQLWCTDFSSAMLEKAHLKLPEAHFALYDLRSGWPTGLPARFDRIVSAYVFHHFELEEKIRLVRELVNEHIASGGRLIIADIAFPDAPSQAALKERLGNEWEEEYYWIASENVPTLGQVGLKVKYTQVSVCAGIFTFQA
jgi:putative AdoMet-dependent methyltransferase